MARRSIQLSVVLLAALALGPSCRKPSADEHFKKATAYMTESRLDDAILEYRLALEADPKRGDIRSKLADAYVEKRDYGNAYREYIRAADLLPDDAAAQIRAGNFLLLARQFEDAKTRAQKVLDKDPKNVDAEILLGNALAGLNQFDAAMAEYQEATVLNPAEDRAYTNTGFLQSLHGDKVAAEASFRKAVEVAPKSVSARLALANFLLASGRTSDAEQTLKDALQLDPANLSASRALGTFYLRSNRMAEAEPYFQAIAQYGKTADDTLALADYYVVAKRNEDARKVLRALAANEKDYAVATVRLAAIDAIEGNRAPAEASLRQVIDKYPKDMSARLMFARLLTVDGKRDQALTEATKIVTEEPTSAQAGGAYLLIGSLQASQQRYEDAIHAYEEVLKRQQQPVAAELALAALHLQMRDFDKAMSYVQQVETLIPKSPVARALMVRILLAEHKNAEARTELASLQKEYPNAIEVLKLTAVQQLIDRQFDAARASYTKVLQLAPTDVEAATGLINADLAAGRKDDAIKRIEAGLKSAPTSADILVLAGRTYAQAGDLDKAQEYLNKAIEIDPSRLDAYTMLAAVYASRQQLGPALEEYQKIVDRNPNSVPANTILAMLLEAAQRLPDAEKQYQKVLALNPRAAVAANNLAWIYVAGNRNLDEALQLAQTALQAMPDEPHVTDTLGWIYYRKDMAAQAVPYLESSVQKNPNDPMGYYHLGMAYVRTGDLDKGRQALQHAVASNVEFDGIVEAKKTLAQIGG